ncbi:MAG: YIP1 family protein [Acidobacteria bacterium]|jgi:hypothetical protein|nr:YIP1 family protein [Acidobacteriota bacterium]
MNQDQYSEQLPSFPEEHRSDHPKLIVPFEDPNKEFMTGLLETIRMVLFKPTYFFKNYKMDGPIGKPVLFAVMVGWTAAINSAIWGTIVNKPIFNFIQEHMPEIEGVDLEKLAAGGGQEDFIFALILAPIFILFGLFIVAGIYHLFLMLVKGNKKNFETTFNVVSYGISARVVEIIPVCGGFIAWIFGLVLAIIGLTGAHETDTSRAAFAVLVPILICCLCIFIIFMMVGISGISALLNQNIE